MSKILPLLSQEERRALEDSTSTNTSTTSSTAVPFLDRPYFHRWSSINSRSSYRKDGTTSTNLPGHSMVRHIGMVQDMLDPEYEYIRRTSTSTSNNENNILHNTNTPKLVECQPLLIVPIPFTEHHYHYFNHHDDATAATAMKIPESPSSQEQQQQQQKQKQQQEQPQDNGDTDIDIDIDKNPTKNSNSRKRNLFEMKQQQEQQQKEAEDDERMIIITTTNNNNNNNNKNNNSHSDATMTPGRDSPHRSKLQKVAVRTADGEKKVSFSASTATTSPSLSSSSSPSSIIYGPDTDWWPVGTLNSPSQHMPILAKVYDDDHHDNALKLNDLVEVYGWIEMENDVETTTTTINDDDRKEEEDMGQFKFLDFNDDTDEIHMYSSSTSIHHHHQQQQQQQLPPSCRLPRLHVLHYRRLTMEDLVSNIPKSIQSTIASSSFSSSSSFSLSVQNYMDIWSTHMKMYMRIPNTLSSSSSSFDTERQRQRQRQQQQQQQSLLIESLFLTLTSQAERQRHNQNPHIMTGQQEMDGNSDDNILQGSIQRVPSSDNVAIGCTSLQIVLQESTFTPITSTSTISTSTSISTTTTNAATHFFEELTGFVKSICPCVATLDLTQDNMMTINKDKDHSNMTRTPTTTTTTTSGINWDQLPSKASGQRLQPNPWQLPQGATLLIHAPQWTTGNTHTPPSFTPGLSKTDEIIEDLLKQYQISYTFEGGMKIPFEADVRIIIVTSTSSSTSSLTSNSSTNSSFRSNPTLQKKLNTRFQTTLTVGLNVDFTSQDSDASFFPQCFNDDMVTELQEEHMLTSTSSSSSTSTTLPGNILRDMVVQARRNRRVLLPKYVLERAAQDFLFRRGHGRQVNSNKETTTISITDETTERDSFNKASPNLSDVPEEQDFHRWLTLTRCYARARGGQEAQIEDWESALALDDTLKNQSF